MIGIKDYIKSLIDDTEDPEALARMEVLVLNAWKRSKKDSRSGNFNKSRN